MSQQALVNDIDSPYGNRWWVPTLERLYDDDDWAMIRTDDGAAVFLEDGEGGYITPAGFTGTLTKTMIETWVWTDVDGSQKTYDAIGRLEERLDARGNKITYDYANGNLVSITDELGQVTTLDYDDGLLATVTDFAGRVISYDYDEEGRAIAITYPDPDGQGGLAAPQLTFTYYDGTNLVASSTDAGGNTTQYEYDEALRISRVIYPDGTFVDVQAADVVGLKTPGGSVGTENNPALLARAEDAVTKIVDEASPRPTAQRYSRSSAKAPTSPPAATP